MKKILMFIILLLPFYVYAEDSCSQDDIQIESITLDSTQGNIEQTSEPNTDNNSINLGLKANVIDDNAVYKVVIKNTSNQDYTFDKSSLSTDYLNYDITYEDDSDIVKAGESKTIYLKVHYATKPAENTLTNGVVTTQPKVTFNLQKEEEVKTIIEEVVNAITNPNTHDKVFIYIGILIISLIITIILLRKYKKAKLTTMLIITFLITTQIVKAVCTCTLNINTELEIDAKEAKFLSGIEFVDKIKLIAGTDTSLASAPYASKDTNIKAFKYSETEPTEANKQEANIVSTSDSPYPIYIWFDNGTVYWWSEDKSPALNENASYMFCRIFELSDISGVENFDTSLTTKMVYIFTSTSLENVDDLSKWNTSNVTDITCFISSNSVLTNIDGLANWNTSKITEMPAAFRGDTNLSSIEGLKKWDTSSIENLNQIFWKANSIQSLKPLSNWNVSKVKAISGSFSEITALTSLEGLENWDTSHIRDMNGVFANDTNLVDIEALRNWDTSGARVIFGILNNTHITSADPLKNWDVSNVEEMWLFLSDNPFLTEVDLSNWNTSKVNDMHNAFNNNINLTVLKLNNWDTSNVTDMRYMFNGLTKLEELDISSFDTSKVTDFTRMFNNSTALKHIYVGEGWVTSANTGETTYVFPTESNLPNFSTSNTNYRDLSYAHTGEGGYL